MLSWISIESPRWSSAIPSWGKLGNIPRPVTLGHLRELVGLSRAATRPPLAAGLRTGGRHFPLTIQPRNVYCEGRPEASGHVHALCASAATVGLAV